MCGIVLLHASWDVVILERSSEQDFRDHGAGLGLRPEVSEFLDRYCGDSTSGTVSALTGAPGVSVINQAGEEIAAFPLPSRTNTTSWSVIVNVLRQSFNKAASSHGVNSRYHHGCQVTSVAAQGKGSNISVEYEDAVETATHSIDGVSLVIGADGANSVVRELFLGPVERPYAGYMLYRAKMGKSDANSTLHETFEKTALMQVGPGLSILSYPVPGRQDVSTIDYTAIIYRKHDSYSEEQLMSIMTDVDGKTHRYGVPKGKLSREANNLIREDLAKLLAPQSQQILDATAVSELIVQEMTNVKVPSRSFLDGKVLLVSDAGGLPRPHTYAGTSKAAFDAMRLKDVLEGRIDINQWVKDTTAYANACIDVSIEIGDILLSDEAPLSKIGKQGALLGKLHGICSGLWQQLGK
jgi:2-polyprenyl-6-methoxyphenol hydroxylase-like FAD-dependent oxidoreductase